MKFSKGMIYPKGEEKVEEIRKTIWDYTTCPYCKGGKEIGFFQGKPCHNCKNYWEFKNVADYEETRHSKSS